MDAISNLKANLNKYISNCDKLAQLDEDDKKDEIKFHGEVAQLTNKHSKDPSTCDNDIDRCNRELQNIMSEIEDLESNMNVIESQIAYVETLTDSIIDKMSDVELLDM